MNTMTSEREAFEKSLKTGDIPTDLRNRTKRNGIYVYDRIQARWEGWQARAHLAQPAQAMDMKAIREVIAYLKQAVLIAPMSISARDGIHEAAEKLTNALADASAK